MWSFYFFWQLTFYQTFYGQTGIQISILIRPSDTECESTEKSKIKIFGRGPSWVDFLSGSWFFITQLTFCQSCLIVDFFSRGWSLDSEFQRLNFSWPIVCLGWFLSDFDFRSERTTCRLYLRPRPCTWTKARPGPPSFGFSRSFVEVYWISFVEVCWRSFVKCVGENSWSLLEKLREVCWRSFVEVCWRSFVFFFPINRAIIFNFF